MNSYRKGPVGSVILPHFSGFTTSASKLGSQSGSGFVPGVHLVNTNTKHSYILFSLSERVRQQGNKRHNQKKSKRQKDRYVGTHESSSSSLVCQLFPKSLLFPATVPSGLVKSLSGFPS